MSLNFFKIAEADIRGSIKYPNIKGKAIFKETKSGILLSVKINGLPSVKDKCNNGKFFGFHIHEGNSCTGNKNDEFADSKTHFNQYQCPHPYHLGDLPPIIENNGNSYMKVLIDKFRLNEIIGKVVIIHSMPDDFTTQPSGNSGEKIACGKIIKKI